MLIWPCVCFLVKCLTGTEKLSRHEGTENQGNSGSDGGRDDKEPMGLPFPKRSDTTGGASRLSRINGIKCN
jgi:hypothetical protein